MSVEPALKARGSRDRPSG